MNKSIKDSILQYKTPFYLYHRDIMEENCRRLKMCIMPGAKLYYAMKANPLIGICQVFDGMGCGIETASMGEMHIALEAGCSPNKIIFTSPGKKYDEIEFAIKKKIKMINVESYEEAVIINNVAKKNNLHVPVAVRVNPAVCYSNAKIKMSGVSSQFGIEEEMLGFFFEQIKRLENLDLMGIQIYMGTQMLWAEDIIKNTDYAIRLGIDLSVKYGFALKYLNLGGGFGVAYFKNETSLDMNVLKKGLEKLKEQYKDELADTEVIFESGRYLMAEAGEFVTKVQYIKESKGNKYIICDGGSNFHSSAAFLGRFVRNNFPITTIPESENNAEFTIVGPLCTPLDVLGQKVSANENIAVGDCIVIEKSGAYGLSYSPLFFLSHEMPAEIMESQGGIEILREHGSYMDFTKGQNKLKEK